MSKKFILLICLGVLLLTGCSSQYTAKNFGGTMTIELDPGEKLEEITWKEGADLWILTRPMREDEVPETHTFKEDSEFGVFQGVVIIVESESK